ncbi:hypothetical protein PMEGAPL128_58820 [Priestia megaterium]
MSKDMFDLDLKTSTSKNDVSTNTVRITTTCFGCAGPYLSRIACGTTMNGCGPYTSLCSTKTDCIA